MSAGTQQDFAEFDGEVHRANGASEAKPNGGGSDTPPKPIVFKTSGEFAASYVQPDYLVKEFFSVGFPIL